MQGKGKKRAVGWFPASYVKLMEAKKEPEEQEAGEGVPVTAGQGAGGTKLTVSVFSYCPKLY